MPRLVRAPYSERNLADADDIGFQLQPFQGGWIVQDHLEYIGHVKHYKAGWKLDGWNKAPLKRAVALLEADGIFKPAAKAR
jgi:hypothetical protein